MKNDAALLSNSRTTAGICELINSYSFRRLRTKAFSKRNHLNCSLRLAYDCCFFFLSSVFSTYARLPFNNDHLNFKHFPCNFANAHCIFHPVIYSISLSWVGLLSLIRKAANMNSFTIRSTNNDIQILLNVMHANTSFSVSIEIDFGSY